MEGRYQMSGGFEVPGISRRTLAAGQLLACPARVYTNVVGPQVVLFLETGRQPGC